MAESGKRLLVAFAHPDDESFGVGGTMARLSDEGWRVTVLCGTRGEVGEISDPSLATPETLGQVREQELRDACRALGVEDVRFLGHRDSGMEGTAENADPRALCNADPDAVAAEIAAVIAAVQPDVVVTWDQSGGYGHPDHLAMHRCVTLAFDRVASAAHGPRGLYYTAFEPGVFDEVAEELKRQGIEFGNDEMREKAAQLPRPSVTTRIDVAPWVEHKQRALAAHRTQMPADSFFNRISADLRRRFLGVETFHRARPPWREGDPIEPAFSSGG